MAFHCSAAGPGKPGRSSTTTTMPPAAEASTVGEGPQDSEWSNAGMRLLCQLRAEEKAFVSAGLVPARCTQSEAVTSLLPLRRRGSQAGGCLETQDLDGWGKSMCWRR